MVRLISGRVRPAPVARRERLGQASAAQQPAACAARACVHTIRIRYGRVRALAAASSSGLGGGVHGPLLQGCRRAALRRARRRGARGGRGRARAASRPWRRRRSERPPAQRPHRRGALCAAPAPACADTAPMLCSAHDRTRAQKQYASFDEMVRGRAADAAGVVASPASRGLIEVLPDGTECQKEARALSTPPLPAASCPKPHARMTLCLPCGTRIGPVRPFRVRMLPSAPPCRAPPS